MGAVLVADAQPEADLVEGAVQAVEVAQAAEGDPAGAAAPAGADDPIVIHAHIMRKLGAMMMSAKGLLPHVDSGTGHQHWNPHPYSAT